MKKSIEAYLLYVEGVKAIVKYIIPLKGESFKIVDDTDKQIKINYKDYLMWRLTEELL